MATQQLSLGGSTEIIPGVVANSAVSDGATADTTSQTTVPSQTTATPSTTLQQAADALFQLYQLGSPNNLATGPTNEYGGATYLAAQDPFNQLGVAPAPASGPATGFTEASSPGYAAYGNAWLDILNTLPTLPGMTQAEQGADLGSGFNDPFLTSVQADDGLDSLGRYDTSTGAKNGVNSQTGYGGVATQSEKNTPQITYGELSNFLSGTPDAANVLGQVRYDIGKGYLNAAAPVNWSESLGTSQVTGGQELEAAFGGAPINASNPNASAELTKLEQVGDPYALADAFQLDEQLAYAPGGATALAQAQTPLIAQAFGLDPSSTGAQELADAFVTDAGATTNKAQYQDYLQNQHRGWVDTLDSVIGDILEAVPEIVLSAGALTPAIVAQDATQAAVDTGVDAGTAAGAGFDAATGAAADATASSLFSVASKAIPAGVSALSGNPLSALTGLATSAAGDVLGSGLTSNSALSSTGGAAGSAGTNTTSSGGGVLSSLGDTLGISSSDLSTDLGYAKDVAGVAGAAVPVAEQLLSPASVPAATATAASASTPAATPDNTPDATSAATPATSTSAPDAPGSPYSAPTLYNPSQSAYSAPTLTSATLGGGLGGNLGNRLTNSDLSSMLTALGSG